MAKSENRIEIVKEIDDSIADQVYLDSSRLQQVLNNLLGNAVKFTNKGEIRFGVVLKDEATLEFFVKDSGIGINEKNHTKIFEMFGQADASSTREHGGSGLGLTISKKLVELMEGKIWVESTVGMGSTFFFTLPYKPLSTTNVKKSNQIQKLEVVKNKLLLVEDNLINQRLTKLILEKAGYEVLTANNGQEAVDYFKKDLEIKLIIMDIQMPVLDGLAATQVIRFHEVEQKLKKTPIIALTAHAMKGDKEKCIEAGCDNYLSKPIMIDVLVDTIKKYV